ncbi:hypothetical protein B0H14DRAFT_3893512 [Mycena olivaceomarginata]|nr:hypothetical protein B0H14DRAFT_3893512 [Mycena olivaceomarginata]
MARSLPQPLLLPHSRIADGVKFQSQAHFSSRSRTTSTTRTSPQSSARPWRGSCTCTHCFGGARSICWYHCYPASSISRHNGDAPAPAPAPVVVSKPGVKGASPNPTTLTARNLCLAVWCGGAGPLEADCVALENALPAFAATQSNPFSFTVLPQFVQEFTLGTCLWAWINTNPIGGAILQYCYVGVEANGITLDGIASSPATLLVSRFRATPN